MGRPDGESYGQRVVNEVKSCTFYRDLLAEFVGTFFIVSVQIILTVHPNNNDETTTYNINIIRVSLGMGFVLAGLVEAFGSFGGANYNPAVSVALTLVGRITVFRAILYIIAQIAGGIVGALFLWGMTNEAALDRDVGGSFALTMVNKNIEPWQGMLVEAWATSILIFVILGATDKTRRAIFMPAIPIGFSLACALLAAIPYTGASVNPARSFGPAVVALNFRDDKSAPFKNHWVYWAGPMIGAVLAAIIYSILHLPDRKKLEED